MTSQVTVWFIKISSSTLFSAHISPCCATLTGVIISVGVHSTTVKFSATFRDTVLSHSTIITHVYQLAMNFDVLKCVSHSGIKSHYRPLYRTKFAVLLPWHSKLLHEQQLNDRLQHSATVPPEPHTLNIPHITLCYGAWCRKVTEICGSERI
jgi:hypothetical protein